MTDEAYFPDDFMDILNFFGYTSGIKDPHVFDIPDICDHQATSDWVSFFFFLFCFVFRQAHYIYLTHIDVDTIVC